MNELKVEWVDASDICDRNEYAGHEEAFDPMVPVVRLAEVDEVIAEAVIQADLFLRTMYRFGQWDDGCFYYNGRSASELEVHIRVCQALLASQFVQAWRTRQEGKNDYSR